MTTLAERIHRLGKRAPGFTAWPRVPEKRYRITYLLDDKPITLASTPNPEALGVALVALAEEDQLKDLAIGILDTKTGGAGWVVNPWRKGS